MDTSKNKNMQDRYTILIVEDEEINYFYLETLIEDFEFETKILHAKNGQEGVDLCKANADISLVLMDMRMPVMDGYEATKLIKEFRPKLKIIAQTAYSRPEDKDKAMIAGCNDFISKPISAEVLSVVVCRYLFMK